MLSMDFEEEINQILAVIPRERKTYLFSATMTSKVAKLQKASLCNPVKVEVSNKFQTPKVCKYYFIKLYYIIHFYFTINIYFIDINSTIFIYSSKMERLLFSIYS